MSEVLIDTFKGDDAKLVGCIEALLKLGQDGALVPNGLGGPNSHAWAMLAAAACRLRAPAPTRQTHQAKGALTDADLRHFAECARAMCEQRCGPLLTISVEGGIKIEKLIAEVERLRAYEVELRRIAEDLGEPNDPFAAWEKLAGRQRPAAMTDAPAPETSASVDLDLIERCKELIEWGQTGLLHGGEGGSLRKLAATWEAKVGEYQALSVAEKETHDQAMKALVSLAAAPQPTAMTAEPVARRWLEKEGDIRWSFGAYEPSTAWKVEYLYTRPATPPSSGNADAVREAAEAVIARWETPAWKDVPATATYINALRAALSSAPVAGEIELKVEQGGAGLWYATSDQIPGLLVAEQTHGLALNKVGHVLWNMQKARLLSRNERGGQR